MTRRDFLRLALSTSALALSACGAAPTVTPTPTRQRAAATPVPASAAATTQTQAIATKPPATSTSIAAAATKQPAAATAAPSAATATGAAPTKPAVVATATTNPSGLRMPNPGYGVHVFLGYTDAATQRDLKLAKDGGFDWVKQRMDWDALSPDEQGQMKPEVLAKYDAIVNAAAASGLKLTVRVGSPPDWAASLKNTQVPYTETKDPPANPPPDDLSTRWAVRQFPLWPGQALQG